MATFRQDMPEFAPALDVEPVFERPAEGRWDIAEVPELYVPDGFATAGVWADARSAYDVPEQTGAAFLDPASFILGSHGAPSMAAASFPAGAIANASADLDSPVFGGGGGGGGGDDKKKGSGGGSLF